MTVKINLKTYDILLILILSLLSLPAEAQMDYTPGLSRIIHRWGFIGDSLLSGENEYTKEDGGKGYQDIYGYSWGQIFCQATGASCEIYAQGGETSHGWIENFWNAPHNHNGNISASQHLQQAYMIALGVNDCHKQLPLGNVDTDINLNDYQKNTDTFAGNYAGIIQRVKSIQPRALFFVVTMPRDNQTDDRYNEVIRRMPQLFENVYLIDLYHEAPDYSQGSEFRSRYFMGGHLTAAGYQMTAWMMLCFVDHIIVKHLKNFNQVEFIGTSYVNKEEFRK